MNTSTKILLASSFYLLASGFFTLRVNAVAPSTLEPDFKGQQYAWPKISESTSDVFDLDTEFFKKYLLYYSVKRVEDSLTPGAYGDLELAILHAKNKGKGVIEINNNRNLCGDVDNALLDQEIGGNPAYDVLAPMLPNLAAKEWGNFALFNSLMRWEKNYDKNAVARKYGYTVPLDPANQQGSVGNPQKIAANEGIGGAGNPGSRTSLVNHMQTGSVYQKTTSLWMQLRDQLDSVTNEHLKCYKNPLQGNYQLCGNQSYVSTGPNTSFTQARYIADFTNRGYEKQDLAKADSETTAKLLSLETLKSSYSLFFVVTLPMCGFFDFGNCTDGEARPNWDDAIVLRVQCPAYTLNKQAEHRFKIQNSLENGKVWEKVYKQTTAEIAGDGPRRWLINKVKDVFGSSCGRQIEYPLNQRGALTSSSKPTGDGIFEWLFSYPEGENEKALHTPMRICIHAIVPPELDRLQKLYYDDDRSMLGNFFSLKTNAHDATYLKEDIARSELPIIDKKSKARTNPVMVQVEPPEIVDCPGKIKDENPSQVCYKKIAVGIEWQRLPKFRSFSPDALDIVFKSTGQPLNPNKGGGDRFATPCWLPNVAAKVNKVISMKTAGFMGLIPFSKILDYGFEITSDCGKFVTYNQADSSTEEVSNEDICVVARQYNIDCTLMKAIYEIETDSGTHIPNGVYGDYDCCNPQGFCGPMQVGGGLMSYLTKDKKLKLCKAPDAFELAARWLLIKRCVTSLRCLSYDWKESYIDRFGLEKFSSNPDERREQIKDFIVGWYGVFVPDQDSQNRWGPGKSYVDAVEYYFEHNTLEGFGNK